ncbi:hypothetical protein HIJ39_18185 [Sulfobacillus sp. DSM 109850]|uniref:site-specific DNA-methyltransferase (adenine-specific) n=1 Tax=Sulfobacillus harzensis TaxID=2729629 RepID=A0A7Y0L982_9FIRM|nr:hypothetical protein [Sulfobacillus harzensis]
MAQARRGDTVFCDPPYVAWSDTANFTDYTVGGFGIADQEELASWAERLAADGITVVISNHATDWTRQLYKTAKQIIVDVPRFISRDGASRKAVQEIIAVTANELELRWCQVVRRENNIGSSETRSSNSKTGRQVQLMPASNI